VPYDVGACDANPAVSNPNAFSCGLLDTEIELELDTDVLSGTFKYTKRLEDLSLLKAGVDI
jgi:hypothetical protein